MLKDNTATTPYPVLDGTINLTTGAYRDTYDALMTHYPKLKLNIAKWWIRFEDPEVKRICIENWDKDGDGELSMEEAAAVSSIGTMFRGNANIKTLKDLRFFTSLDDDAQQIVAYCPNLIEVWVPESMTFIGSWFSLGTPRLRLSLCVERRLHLYLSTLCTSTRNTTIRKILKIFCSR